MSNQSKDNEQLKAVVQSLKKTVVHIMVFSSFMNALSLALPIYSLQVLDRVLGSSSLETLLYLSLIVFVMLIAMNCLTNIRETAFSYLSRLVSKQLQAPTFMACFSRNLNQAASQTIKDLTAIRQFITGPQLPLIFDALWFWVFLGVIFYIHRVPGFLISAAAIVLCVMSFINQKVLKKDTETLNQKNIILGQKLDCLVQNSEVVLSMNMEDALAQRYQDASQEIEETDMALKKKTRRMTFIIKSFRFTVQVAITMVSAYLIIKGKMSAGAYIAISILASKVLAPFDASPALLTALITVKKAYKRINNALNEHEGNDDAMPLPEPKGNVSVHSLAYVMNQVPIIKPMQFDINAGECIGLIGKSGSGKTTLARLLTQVYYPSRGKVTLDGGELRNWNPKQLGEVIGYLPQDVELFHGSVRDNIAKMAIENDPDMVIEAAQLTGNHAFILSLSQGYDTILTPTALSAGQKQRIALARAFFGSVKLVVLDEPNANLDIEGEKALMDTLIKAKQKHITVVIVSHKPSILSVTDKILVLEKGELRHFDESKKVIEALQK